MKRDCAITFWTFFSLSPFVVVVVVVRMLIYMVCFVVVM